MFSGIITDIGRIAAIERHGDARLWVECGYELSTIPLGASIAHNGVCLTVASKEAGRYAVDVSNETLSKTTIGQWEEGAPVNLELSLKMGDEISGHLVYGHVDGVATIHDRQQDGESTRFVVHVPDSLMPYIAAKGSVAIDGVSLTVNEVMPTMFGINIVPHTAEKTTFGHLEPGSSVNLEIDMLARYVARLMETRA
ncbi:MAG: riboflavin synthase [Pseudomonadota bacterium]